MKYIVVCRYSRYYKWEIYVPNDKYGWLINDDTVPSVLYNEDNKFGCLRYEI